MKHDFLPISREDMKRRGMERLDFVYVVGEAYIDHPSFGHAIISRVLESEGYTVGIIAQPDWRTAEAFKQLGKPRLGFLVSAGNMDSMVNHYTAAKKKRSQDSYSPGGKAGLRPDRATIVYCNRVREAYGDVPLIIGGVEASLRRFAHYDYWDDKVRRSILLDSRADLLLYGMGEKQMVQVARLLAQGTPVKSIQTVPGTACIVGDKPSDATEIPSFEQVREDKQQYAISCKQQYECTGRMTQQHFDKWLVVNPPMPPLSTSELDRVYALPYQRTYHPVYEAQGGVPAITEVKFSITSSRGCFGGCSFCALAFHQGRKVTSRSHASILAEAKKLVDDPDFKGYINDVGGPTANFRSGPCNKKEPCTNKRCLYPNPCKQLFIDHRDYLSLLRKLRTIPGVKKVFVRSGIRYDYLVYDQNTSFFNELCEHHVSGQLKVAPEHVSQQVLSLMGKPSAQVYDRFADKFYAINKKIGKKQFLVPYLMSSHPGSTLDDAIMLAEYLRDNKLNPEQVQDFYPTPGTISTCMYHTGIDPRTMQTVYVPKKYEEKQMQRALLQFRRPQNAGLVRKALKQAGREDLIGYGATCFVTPQRPATANSVATSNTSKQSKGERTNGNHHRRKSSGTAHSGGPQKRGGKPTTKGRTARPGSDHRRG